MSMLQWVLASTVYLAEHFPMFRRFVSNRLYLLLVVKVYHEKIPDPKKIPEKTSIFSITGFFVKKTTQLLTKFS